MAQGNDTVEQRVVAIIAEHLGVETPEDVSSEASLASDLGADSLDMVEIIMAMEEEFDIEIPDEDAEEIETVGEVIAYVKQVTAAASQEQEVPIGRPLSDVVYKRLKDEAETA